ncbi:MAG: hypothetical protein IV100_04935 [Myxococcales bacterium]|nr:hypothetical protein [Myxococcales bacterium]
MTNRQDRAARAEQRRERLLALAQAPKDESDARPHPRGVEGMALAGELTRIAWAFSQRSLPTLPRSEWPCRLVPLRDGKA